MQIFTDISGPLPIVKPVITIGTFDGVHLGHQAILTEVKRQATLTGGQSVVVSFNPHPRIALGQRVQLLNTNAEKQLILAAMGIDCLVEIPFTTEFSKMPAESFVQLIGRIVQPETIILGYDHGFGHQRSGTIDQFFQMGNELGFRVIRIKERVVNNERISSTIVRWLLGEGQVEKAAQLLGYHYSVEGNVIRGNQIGKLIGYPTANINPSDPHKLIPAMGVYASLITVKGREFKSMTNIGVRPTINEHTLTIETHIFDFDDDIYYENIQVKLVKRIRNEKRFANLEALSRQLQTDGTAAREILKAV